MTFASFTAEARTLILLDLDRGLDPSLGKFDGARLAQARAHGKPRLGAMLPSPHSVVLEFPFFNEEGAAMMFSVELATPERVVYLGVPPWVVENVWQGTVDGTYVFESQARAMLDEFAQGTAPGPNAAMFGARAPTRRE